MQSPFLISVDPGKKKHALSFFNEEGLLDEIGFWDGTLHNCSVLAVEIPRIYPGQKQIGDPNDIVDLAVAAGEFIGSVAAIKVVKYFPRQWKGQASKPLSHHRIWKELTLYEKRLFPKDTYERIQKGLDGGPYSAAVHNLLDATGIGLFALGRHFQ